MNILLIGGNGFVGKEFIRLAVNRNINISYLSRNKINEAEFKSISWIQGDIFSIDDIYIEEKFDVAIHLVGTIKNKQLYKKLNTESVAKSLQLCSKYNIKKLVYFSAKGGFADYYNSKKNAEQIIEQSNIDYLIVRPGLMYGTNRLSSYFNVIPIKLFATLGISFFKNVYPLPVSKVVTNVINTITNNPTVKYLDIEEIK
ncbi:NAD(P)H-binding protein [Gemella sanguinis]|uniref:NAD(P)H-binding protein n=1 Tax=Gemella sanguinis TaxID=84135 RepID=UPI0004E22554|nr:NAD(P)H-binding protein [Gemella sanguinis]NKZ25619.1 NAD(P)H-binding protein [Gemella sanguinis]